MVALQQAHLKGDASAMDETTICAQVLGRRAELFLGLDLLLVNHISTHAQLLLG